MGKGTDKLYITHSEWSSSGAYSASVGANASARASSASSAASAASFRRLPFNFCAASLQPFRNPVCTPAGTIFDVDVIASWLDKHPGRDPVTGGPLERSDLIRLVFARSAEAGASSASPAAANGDLVDPVTYKVLTDNTHVVAIRHGSYANVFAWETVERINIKAKLWQDLVDDEPFTRADIITLQDPQNAAARSLDQFEFLRHGGRALLTPEQEAERGASDINAAALGSMGDKVLRAKAAVDKARRARDAGGDVNRSTAAAGAVAKASSSTAVVVAAAAAARPPAVQEKKLAANSATYTTGRAAASFTSTGLTPETSGERALLTDEEFMLKPRRVRNKGYARIETNLGDVTIELQTETAPRAVWNFVRLAQKGYYRGVAFHRNIPGFMIQGGDPSGTGKGGQSIWGRYFNDEFDGPLTHKARGTVSMANKGKNTNSSQFFVTYEAAPHLDRKHTIFGLVAPGASAAASAATLAKMEAAPTDGSNRPLGKIVIGEVVVLIDPFEEFQAQRKEEERRAEEREAIRRQGGTDDDRTTWTGKRIRGGGAGTAVVGKHLGAAAGEMGGAADDVDTWEEPVKKKPRAGGFGNFDGW